MRLWKLESGIGRDVQEEMMVSSINKPDQHLMQPCSYAKINTSELENKWGVHESLGKNYLYAEIFALLFK